MIEIIATFFSLLSVYLGAKNNILTWPLGIIGIIFYGILFYNNNIVGNAILQILFLIQSIFGWIRWGENRSIEELSIKGSIINIVVCSLIACCMIYILNLIGSNNPLMDGITTSLSIIGLLLMSYSKIDSWYYWIIADIIFVIFFIKVDLYLSAITYFIFLLLAIYGLKKWKNLKTV